MIVVSDTSPLRYLIETGVIDVLPKLFGNVLTTSEVIRELRQEGFPDIVAKWAESPPAWLTVASPASVRFTESLDEGEAEALSLAIERHADVLLIDERKGTRVAQENGIKTAGTLAVLHDAGLAGLIDFHLAIDRLTKQTQFHYSQSLIDQVIENYDQQVRQQDKK